MAFLPTQNHRNPSQKRRGLPKGFFYRFMLASLAFSLALGASCSAPPEKPIQPTVQMTETIEEPSEAPTQAPTTAPTEIPTQEPTLSPAERNYEWTNKEAVTVKAELTEEELNEQLKNLPNFPLVYYEPNGTYLQLCILESISFLKEGSYISVGDFNVRVTGQCSYLDINREKQTITVAMVVENAVEKTTWVPFLREINPHRVAPTFIQEYFTTITGIEPGMEIGVSFNLPNPNNENEYVGRMHFAELVSELYTEEDIELYTKTGDPSHLENLLVPFGVSK